MSKRTKTIFVTIFSVVVCFALLAGGADLWLQGAVNDIYRLNGLQGQVSGLDLAPAEGHLRARYALVRGFRAMLAQRYGQADLWMDSAVAHTPVLEDRVAVRWVQSNTYRALGRDADADAADRKMIKMTQRAKRPELEMQLSRSLADGYLFASPARAEKWAQHGADVARRVGNAEALKSALKALEMIQIQRGHCADAAATAEEIGAVAGGDARNAMQTAGECYAGQGEPAKAVPLYRKAVAATGQAPSRKLLTEMGDAQRLGTCVADAETTLRQALAAPEPENLWQSRADYLLALILEKTHHPAEARQSLAASWQIWQRQQSGIRAGKADDAALARLGDDIRQAMAELSPGAAGTAK